MVCRREYYLSVLRSESTPPVASCMSLVLNTDGRINDMHAWCKHLAITYICHLFEVVGEKENVTPSYLSITHSPTHPPTHPSLSSTLVLPLTLYVYISLYLNSPVHSMRRFHEWRRRSFRWVDDQASCMLFHVCVCMLEPPFFSSFYSELHFQRTIILIFFRRSFHILFTSKYFCLFCPFWS